MSPTEKDTQIARIVAYYKTRSDLAFSSFPKNMELMEEQPYSLAFRQKYPKFNGLIWGYHWLQVGLYEPMMIGKTQEERQAGVAAAVSRFRQMLVNAPEHMPRVMPMTAAIAPTFAKRYQEASIIFDNLHAMHDVISDILANEKVPRHAKRAAILEAANRYRDNTTFLMPIAEWATMGEMMGVVNMGGPAVNILPGWPTPTIARGATMDEAMKAMPGMAHGAPGAAAMPGMTMGGAKPTDSASAHAAMPGMGKGHDMHAMGSMPMTGHDSAMMRLHERMMRDPVIRQRMMADSSMRRMMSDMKMALPPTHDMHGVSAAPAPSRSRAASGAKAVRSRARPIAKPKSTGTKPQKSTKPAPLPSMRDMKGMPGMKH